MTFPYPHSGGRVSIVTNDPYFDNVSLLAGFNGANGATTYTEESSAARTATFYGDAQLSTTSPKFDTAAALFDENGDVITFPNNSAFQFGSGKFTVECWYRANSLANQGEAAYLVALYDTNNQRSWALTQISSVGALRRFGWVYSTNGTSATVGLDPNLSISTGIYIHLVADRDGSNVTRLYKDGEMLAKFTDANTYHASTGNLSLGGFLTSDAPAGNYFNGRLDDVRITKGISRYGDVYGDGSFTVPVSAFPRS